MQLEVVPTPIRSYRLLAMSMDEDGFIWTGSTHRVIHRYDPRTGNVLNFPLPYDATASACLCAGKKVYVLGQSYPRLIIYQRERQQFEEQPYSSSKPDVWYGTEAVDGQHLYLFDRGSDGVLQWDTQTDAGTTIPYPYSAPPPGGGAYEARDGAIWCRIWDNSTRLYAPLGIARLETKSDQFTGWWSFPQDDTGLEPFSVPDTTFFLPFTLRGKIVPFDFQAKRWCRFLSVPGFGERFGFIGGPIIHQGRYYFPLSTYNGTDQGCDGLPYHFCNAILELDPHSRQFEFLTLEAEDAYYQIAYTLSANGAFYATGSNIREPDGRLNRDRAGEVVFWQSRRGDSR
jgi:hypothetical protein